MKSFIMLFDFVYVGPRAHYQGLYLGDSHHLFLALRICPVRGPKCEYGIQSSFMQTKRKLRIQNSDLIHNKQEDEIFGVNKNNMRNTLPLPMRVRNDTVERKLQRPINSLLRSSKKGSSLSIQRYVKEFALFTSTEGLLWLPLPLFLSSRFFHETTFRNSLLTSLEVLLL